MFGTVACVVALMPLRQSESAPSALVMPSSDTAPARGAPPAVAPSEARPAPVRHIYPYSIVPGGVTGKADLIRAIRADKAVAEHYASFAVDKAALVRVDKPRGVYVSYRKNGQIYWTAKKVMLAEGETVLSDGVNEIRTRCGNRISDVPQMPVAPGEPSQEVLDTSVDVPVDGEAGGAQQVSMTSGDVGNNAPAVSTGNVIYPYNGGVIAGAPQPSRSTFASADRQVPVDNRGLLPYTLLGLTASAAGTSTPATSAVAHARSTGGAADTALTALRDSLSSTGTGSTGSSTGGATETGGTGTSGTGTTGTGDTGNTGTTTDTSGTGTPGANGAGTGGTTTSTPAAPAATSDTVGNGKTDAPAPTTIAAPQPNTTPGKTPLQHADVPEPGSLWLSGLGLAAMGLLRRARRVRG